MQNAGLDEAQPESRLPGEVSINSDMQMKSPLKQNNPIHDYWKKAIALTIWNFVGKIIYLLFNILSRLVITFLPRSKRLLISWLNHHLQ